MNKFFTVIFALAVTAIISGCGEKKEAALHQDQSFENVKKAGVLVMGHMGDFPPMVFTDKDGKTVGFDVDLAKEVCSRLGLKLKLQQLSWADKEKELYDGDIDCVWSGMSVDSSRAESMKLSEPYLTNRMVFTVKNKALNSLDSLKGKKIGLQNASTARALLEESEIRKNVQEVVMFDGISQALDAMEQDSVDALFMDEVAAKYWNVANNKDYAILDESLANELYAIGFRKADQALRDTINAVLTSMKKDGKFVEITIKWFGK